MIRVFLGPGGVNLENIVPSWPKAIGSCQGDPAPQRKVTYFPHSAQEGLWGTHNLGGFDRHP